jgi:crotonobetainyl-CoA:carnitine CoA-transferase CaiB-like acyl-CoA transferase
LDEHGGELEERPAQPGTGPKPAHPLEGVTIVELGYFYAMPYGVTMAAGLGARVIKVEGLAGDPMRTSFGAAETGAAKTMEGKESLAVDLQAEEGRRIVRELVAKADVFVNGFRPGVAERLGLGDDDIRAINPRLVYVHAAGYGTDGPLADRAIYAQVAQAVAGSIARFAGQWLDPTFTKTLSTLEAQVVVLPRLRGVIDGDSNAALAVLSSVLLGVYAQRRTGTGQYLSTTMIGGNALSYADDFVRYEGKPDLPVPDDDKHGLHALYRLYRAGAGWVFLAAPRQVEWEALATGLDQRALLTDERFVDAERRATNDEALATLLGENFATRPAAEWEALLAPHGVACVEVFLASHSEFTCTDKVLRESGLVVEVDHPYFGPIVRHAPIVTLSETPARIAPGCMAGQHTEAILTELRYTTDQIAALHEAGTVGIWSGERF